MTMVRLSLTVPEATWRRLRDLAETERQPGTRANLAAVVGRLIERELSKQRPAAERAEAEG